MKTQQILQKSVYEKLYVHKIADIILSKIELLRNAKKTCKPNNRNLNCNWIKFFVPSDFMEVVVPIINKPWHEGGNVNFLLNRARINSTRETTIE